MIDRFTISAVDGSATRGDLDLTGPWVLYHAHAARVAQTCGTCAHSNDDDSPVPSIHVYCTNANSFYRARLMEKSARCKTWEGTI